MKRFALALTASTLALMIASPGTARAWGVGRPGDVAWPLQVIPLLEDIDDPAVETVTPEEGARVVPLAYSAYLRSAVDCKDQGGGIDRQRQLGNMMPTVEARARGSFTAVGAREVLYLVALHECGATHADNWGSMELVVLRGQKVVARGALAGGTLLERVVDVDGDGRAELVLTQSTGNQGLFHSTAQLVDIGAGGLAVLKDFDVVGASSCGSLEPNPGQSESYVYALVTRGKPLTFARSNLSRPCPTDP